MGARSYRNTLAYYFQTSLARSFLINSRISVFHFQTNKPSNYVIVMKQRFTFAFTFAETIRSTTLRAAGCLTTIYIVCYLALTYVLVFASCFYLYLFSV